MIANSATSPAAFRWPVLWKNIGADGSILLCCVFGSKRLCFNYRSVEKTLYSEHSKILQEHLRALREQAGMTQRDLAAAIGKDHGTVAKIELGERRLDVIEFFAVVSAIGPDPSKEASRLMERFKA